MREKIERGWQARIESYADDEVKTVVFRSRAAAIKHAIAQLRAGHKVSVSAVMRYPEGQFPRYLWAEVWGVRATRPNRCGSAD